MHLPSFGDPINPLEAVQLLFLAHKKEEPPSSGRLPSINSKLQLQLYVTEVCLAMQLWFFQQAGFLLFRVILAYPPNLF
jgi:hypothetical protein